jgi:hypothetical protein
MNSQDAPIGEEFRMAIRGTLQDIVKRVRGLIQDPAGEGQTFSDEDIQETCDQHRIDIDMELLEGTLVPRAGVWLCQDFYSEWGFWEADARITDAGGNLIPLNEVHTEYRFGHFYTVSSQAQPLYATGKVFDPFGAATDLLVQWAAKVALDFDFRDTDQQYTRSQKQKQLLEVAKQYASKSWPTQVRAGRSDAGSVTG